MCCMRLAGNTEPKNDAKHRHLRIIAQLCWAICSQPRHVSTIGKKVAKQQYPLHMSSHYGNFGSLTAEICWWVWGTPANFNGFRVTPQFSAHVDVVAKRLDGSRCHLVRRWASAQATLCQMRTQLPNGKWHSNCNNSAYPNVSRNLLSSQIFI